GSETCGSSGPVNADRARRSRPGEGLAMAAFAQFAEPTFAGTKLESGSADTAGERQRGAKVGAWGPGFAEIRCRASRCSRPRPAFSLSVAQRLLGRGRLLSCGVKHRETAARQD